MFDERLWKTEKDLAEAFLVWGHYAYAGDTPGAPERELFETRLRQVDAIVHNQDNREHDILDSDDYYQFAGGLAVTARVLKGEQVPVYHGDHSRPERPVIRRLEEEIGRVVRARAVNPKWIEAMMRHGYKGAFEIAATVDYLFAFAATTGAVRDHHFEAVYNAYIADERVRNFIAEKNPGALRDIAERLKEAIDRGLWSPASNSAYARLNDLLARRKEPSNDLAI
jgi:cobaltochelatase CobN